MFLKSFRHFLIPIEFPFCSSLTSRSIKYIYNSLNLIHVSKKQVHFNKAYFSSTSSIRISVRILIFWLLTSSLSASARIINVVAQFNGVGVWYPFTFFHSSMQTVKIIFVMLFKLLVWTFSRTTHATISFPMSHPRRKMIIFFSDPLLT